MPHIALLIATTLAAGVALAANPQPVVTAQPERLDSRQTTSLTGAVGSLQQDRGAARGGGVCWEADPSAPSCEALFPWDRPGGSLQAAVSGAAAEAEGSAGARAPFLCGARVAVGVRARGGVPHGRRVGGGPGSGRVPARGRSGAGRRGRARVRGGSGAGS